MRIEDYRKKFPGREEKVIELYQANNSGLEIARILNMPKNTVFAILKRNGFTELPRGRFNKTTEQEIANKYAAGTKPIPLSREYGCDAATIRNIAKKYGVTIRPKGNQPKPTTTEMIVEIVKLWKEKLSQQKIADKLGISQIRVSRILRREGLGSDYCVADRNGNWKGGRISNGQGYIMIRIYQNDLCFCMTNLDGYALEHRVVMAKHLGRPLRQDEQVHHINGQKDDNRIENLQLTQGTHGVGQAFKCLDCGSCNVEPIQLH